MTPTDEIKAWPMKRFLCFAYDTYYPGGGLGDCFAWFDTIDEAKAAFTEETMGLGNSMSDYRYIVDSVTGGEIDMTDSRNCA